MLNEMLKPVDIQEVSIKDKFWSRYIELVHDVVIPYQWELINDHVDGAEKSGCIQNFKIAAGEMEGNFIGMPFQDSDLAKWLEAAAFSLSNRANEKLEKIADEVIDLLEKAQESSGYLDTYFMLVEPEKRWMNLLEGHELYVAGHFIEAGVAYYKAVGKKKLLDIVCRLADEICRIFGVNEGQLRGYPGHQEVELALVKLYRATGERKYLEKAKYFIDERGKEPYILKDLHDQFGRFLFPEFEKFDRKYLQTHLPVREQKTAEGHAVRAVYMYSAMADIAYEYQDRELLKICETIFNNIVQKRMYITGSIGSCSIGERFTCDYDLPNDTNYSESCASIGLAMFCQRMFSITGDGKYVDIMENTLYNTIAAGISLTGKEFFYVNPLEVWPESCEKNPIKEHIKTERQEWFACACCPPNIARTLASLQSYAYHQSEDTIFINLFMSSKGTFKVNGESITMELITEYPFGDTVKIALICPTGVKFSLALHKPEWCDKFSLKIEGEKYPFTEVRGYIYIDKSWNGHEVIEYQMEMKAKLIAANPKVRADAGKAAIVKGPLVYCLEACDNGENLAAISIKPDVEFVERYDPDLLGGIKTLTFEGRRLKEDGWSDKLYQPWNQKYEEVTLKAIPYCFWNNRGKHEMQVWTRVDT